MSQTLNETRAVNGFEAPGLYESVRRPEATTRVLIGGFDNAGKSTLACSLYRALNQAGIPTSLYELDRWSDTHDIILGRKLPEQRQKTAEVSVEEFAAYAEGFREDPTKLVLGDLQGVYQVPHNLCLRQSANFGVLVTRNPIDKDATARFPQTLEGWRDLFGDLEIPIALHLHSVQAGQTAPDKTIPIPALERGLVPNHPYVQKIAAKILQLSGLSSPAWGMSW